MNSDTITKLDYRTEISNTEFRDRLATLHRRAWASEPYDFDTVMRNAYKPPEDQVLVDLSLLVLVQLMAEITTTDTLMEF